MKRTPMKPRKSRLKRVNQARKAQKWTRQFHSHARVSFVKSQTCVACGALPPCENHHVVSRGAGGTFEDIVPLCVSCHRELHGPNGGIKTFEKKHGVDLKEAARLTQEAWEWGDTPTDTWEGP